MTVEESFPDSDFEQADEFLGNWIADCTPEQLREAIIHKKDWRVVFANEAFKEDALASLDSRIRALDQYTFGLKLGTRLANYYIRKYARAEIIEAYVYHMRLSFPEHWAVIWYTPGGKKYVVDSVLAALQQLLKAS